MNALLTLESLENRRLLSASLVRVGASGGSTASTVTPTFDKLHATSHATNPDGEDVNAGVTPFDQDSALKVSVASNEPSIDATALTRAAVRLIDTTTGHVYTSSDPNSELEKIKTSGGGDTIVIQTKQRLPAGDTFTLELNGTYTSSSNYIKTVDGDAFADKTFTFTTDSYYAHPSVTAAFTNPAVQAAAGSHGFTALTMGPDGDLYAADSQGFIYRYTIGSDGTLSLAATITTVRDNNITSTDTNGARLITGIAFSPLATSSDPLVMYVSHGAYQFGNDGHTGTGIQDYAQNFSGKISTVSGGNLDSYEDLVVNIPRSAKDHMNNQIVFQPNGRALYFGLAAMNAMGGPSDATWGNRVEDIYTGTIMQLRLGSGPTGINTFLHASGAVNLLIDGTDQTATGLVAGSTHYNIFKGSNPLRIYADGIRNDYDMVFASNGHLYAGINGSSAGGNTPATPSASSIPVQNRPDKDSFKNRDGSYITPTTNSTSTAETDVHQVEEDSLYDVTNGAYFGHPNPARGEYVLDAGNTGGTATDPYQFSAYPVGTQPDRSYTRAAYDFGQDYSPDGMIQYKSVNGQNEDLNGYLLVCRYSSGGDILGLLPKADGTIDTNNVQQGIPGLTGLNSPLDVVEDPNTGNLYTAVLTDETGAGSIELMKPTTVSGTPAASASAAKLGFYVTPGGHSTERTVTLTNTGGGQLVFDPSTARVGGSGRKDFAFVDFPTTQQVLTAGESITLTLNGRLPKGQTTTAAGTLYLTTNASNAPTISILLRAFDSSGSTASSVASAAAVRVPSAVVLDASASGSLIKQFDLDA